LVGLREIVFVTLPNDVNDRTTRQTLEDAFTIAMARKLPELKLTDGAGKGEEWLALSWVLFPDRGLTMELSVLRWVRLDGSNKLFMAKVWQAGNGIVFGKVEAKWLTDEVDKLVTRLAADYLTANPPRAR
jgi:hypothetical protein